MLGSRFSWSEVVDVGVAEAYRDDAAVEDVVFIRAMSHECNEVCVSKRDAWKKTAAPGAWGEVVRSEGR